MYLSNKNRLRNYYAGLRILISSEKGQSRNGGRALVLCAAFYFLKRKDLKQMLTSVKNERWLCERMLCHFLYFFRIYEIVHILK